jgi:excinuclease UvrABC helicase subunit UvrB
MQDAADNLDFERAIALRDQIKKLNERVAAAGRSG